MLAICFITYKIAHISQHEVPRLLNYLTAPNVVIWSAACASCALGGLFAPVEVSVCLCCSALGLAFACLEMYILPNMERAFGLHSHFCYNIHSDFV